MERMKYKPAFEDAYKELKDYVKTLPAGVPLREKIRSYCNYKSLEFSQAKSSVEKYDEVYYHNCFVHDLNKDLRHIFIEDDGLRLFLESTKVRSYQLLKDFLEDMTTPSKNYKDAGFKIKELHFAAHTAKESYVIMAIAGHPSKTEPDEKALDCYYLGVWTHDGHGKSVNFIPGKHEPDIAKLPKELQVAANILLYMKAFPECLREGVPQNMPKNDRNKTNNNFSLKVAPQIVEKFERSSDGRVVIPHFRSGAFHYLKSDRYKNKKGQVIWWSPTMVKGRAETLEPAKKKKTNCETRCR